MRIALTAEGTYPHHFGGVSVWCDQLIRGLPEHDFDLVALVATGAEPVRWELPGNVVSLAALPLWGRTPRSPRSTRSRRSRRAARLGRPLRPGRVGQPLASPQAASAPAGDLVGELVDVLLAPPEQEQDRFGWLMRELFGCAQQGTLAGALVSERSVALLSRAWRDDGSQHGVSQHGAGENGGGDAGRAAPTVHDAVTALQLLEHALRPLGYPPARADVVHTVTNGLGVLPALAAHWRYGTPVIVTEHGIALREQFLHSRQGPYRWPVRRLYLRFLRRLCALAYQQAQMITPGNVYNQRWEAQLGADLTKVRTIYNGVNPADFPALVGEPEVPTISWAGRIDPVKDLETLLHAFCLVRGRLPDARLRIFGAPPPGQEPYLERCRALAAELGLAGAVSFEGRVEHIRDAYAAGQIVVLCSITEGFPYTLIEAMTCGRPCVGTDVGGVTEAIGDTGLTVPPRSPQPLAQACLSLLEDAGARRRLGAAARLRALEYFTVDRAISAFDELYAFLGAGRPLPVAQPQARPAAQPEAQLPVRPALTAAQPTTRPAAQPAAQPTIRRAGHRSSAGPLVPRLQAQCLPALGAAG
jgi:glycosyltransferase involved in cell wall biosynthesis